MLACGVMPLAELQHKCGIVAEHFVNGFAARHYMYERRGKGQSVHPRNRPRHEVMVRDLIRGAVMVQERNYVRELLYNFEDGEDEYVAAQRI